MEEILKLIIESLVVNTEDVKINAKEEENNILFEVSLNKEDMGRVIGRQGKMARSIRTVMKSIASRENKKVQIEFIG